MTFPRGAAVTQLAQLIWQPGSRMDDGWWRAFEMKPWREVYRRHPVCRAHIDALLIARRGWPSTGEALRCVPPRSEAARAMLRLVPDLRRIALAYGLRALGCPDYLLLGVFRRALSPWLDAWQCDRLLLTRSEWPARSSVAPEALAGEALSTAGACLDAASASSCDEVATMGAAVRILLPPAHAPAPATIAAIDADRIWQRFSALEKMLCMSSTLH
ncbi:type III secretion system domain-containing protein [Pandoraea pulmonicola]|uniref:Uncharacterized protein n=2 Tax=Pandoraea pulmonicola TaxID=93221 RepID=A0AAJ5CZY1_PANPU|nr:type III secretion system domain-containing protein [Pandoraea pulmonicola]SUA90186.1 Uncharacterised protein [Pandoraea pulmonicola]